MYLRSLFTRISVLAAVRLGLLLVASQVSLAQFVALRSIDCSQFPRIRSSFCAFDATGKPAMLDTTRDRKVFDNSTRQTLGSISFIPAPAPHSASLCLLFDRSSTSLNTALDSSLNYIDTSLITPHLLSVAGFGSLPYITNDIKRSFTSLITNAKSLPRLEGCSFNTALADSLCGAIHLVQRDTLVRSPQARAVILVTASQATVNVDSISSLLRSSGIELFVITVGALSSSSLRTCALASGGFCLDSVSFSSIAQSINACLHAVRGMTLSVLDWSIDASSCDSVRRARFDIRSLASGVETVFSIPDSLLRVCAALPSWQSFDPVPVNDSVDIPFRVTAVGADITLVDVVSNNPLFRVINVPRASTVSRNSPALCTLRFVAIDSLEHDVTLRVITSACDTATVYYHMKGSLSRALRPRILSRLTASIVRPFSTIDLLWSGVPMDASLQVLLSVDGGSSWLPQTVQRQGFRVRWTAPQIESPSCLLLLRDEQRGTSDTSDVFSIASSPVTFTPLSFDTVRSGDVLERTFTNCIRNTSASLLVIDSIRATHERIDVLSGEQCTLAPGASSHLRLQLWPREEGEQSDTLQVWCRNDYLRIPLRSVVRKRLLDAPATIAMNAVGIGGEQDTIVRNAIRLLADSAATTSTLTVDLPDSALFSVSSTTLPFRHQSSSPAVDLRITYKADSERRSSAGLIVHTSDGAQRIRLVADGVCAAPSMQTSLRLPDSLVVSVGASTTIPIRYTPLPRGYVLRDRPWQLIVRVPESILVPIGSTPGGERDRGDRRIVLNGRGALGGDTIAIPEFTTALGRDHDAVVWIESFRWTDECGGVIASQSSLLHVRNACSAGGNRAFLDGDSLSVRTIAPNPSDDHTQVRFVLREENDTRLELVDVYGRTLLRTESTLMSRGDHEFTLQTSDLHEGTYYLVIATPTGSCSAILKVMR